MNKFLVMAMATICFEIRAQDQHAFYGGRINITPPPPTVQELNARNMAQMAADAQDVIEKQKYFVPRDPWRITTNQLTAYEGWKKEVSTNYAKGGLWLQFDGEVKAVLKDGIILCGWLGPAMDFAHGQSNTYFVVCNFPYDVKSGTVLQRSGRYVARRIESNYSIRYTSYNGSFIKLDYGKVCPPPKTNAIPATVTAKVGN